MICGIFVKVLLLLIIIFCTNEKQELLTYGCRIPFAELFARIDAVDASIIKWVGREEKMLMRARIGSRLPSCERIKVQFLWTLCNKFRSLQSLEMEAEGDAP